jgi:2-succinyl-6-hydroxy-2,4-cyclohexadiene-1-carboxylate synthase
MTAVLIPGFAQTAGIWNRVIEAADVECLALEVPERKSWDETVETLAEMGGAGTYVGYSMGGRLALGLALAHPELVKRLVLVSAGAGIAHPDDREMRSAQDRRWAEIVRSSGVEAFLDKWLDQPLFDNLGPAARSNRIQDPERIGSQLEVLGQAQMPSYWERLAEIEVSVTVLAGELDSKYVQIGEAMQASIGPNAGLDVVIGAGHSLVLQAPEIIAGLL